MILGCSWDNANVIDYFRPRSPVLTIKVHDFSQSPSEKSSKPPCPWSQWPSLEHPFSFSQHHAKCFVQSIWKVGVFKSWCNFMAFQVLKNSMPHIPNEQKCMRHFAILFGSRKIAWFCSMPAQNTHCHGAMWQTLWLGLSEHQEHALFQWPRGLQPFHNFKLCLGQALCIARFCHSNQQFIGHFHNVSVTNCPVGQLCTVFWKFYLTSTQWQFNVPLSLMSIWLCLLSLQTNFSMHWNFSSPIWSCMFGFLTMNFPAVKDHFALRLLQQSGLPHQWSKCHRNSNQKFGLVHHLGVLCGNWKPWCSMCSWCTEIWHCVICLPNFGWKNQNFSFWITKKSLCWAHTWSGSPMFRRWALPLIREVFATQLTPSCLLMLWKIALVCCVWHLWMSCEHQRSVK